MVFKVEVANVGRDRGQGQLGNRQSSDSSDNRIVYENWNDLVVRNSERKGVVQFGAIETGGADPQSLENFLGEDFTERDRLIAESAPDSGQRPLTRAHNVHSLVPHSPLAQQAGTLENIRNSGGVAGVKAFDSQGDFSNIRFTAQAIHQALDEGHEVKFWVSMPFADGHAGAHLRDPEYAELDPYPVEFYAQKTREAIEKVEEYGLKGREGLEPIFDLKGMVGDMDAATAEEKTRAVIQELKAAGLDAAVSLHLHDTGLSKEAYVAAIKVAKEEGWPVYIDTVEGHDTGFVALLELDEALKQEGIDLGLTEEDKANLNTIREANDRIGADYNIVRTSGALTGEDKRNYGMPSGGESAFETSPQGVLVKQFDFGDASEGEKPVPKTLATKLGISNHDALHLAGHGLIAARQLMGWPFGVTPGFAMTQDASLHLLHKMISAGHITPDMSVEDMKKKAVAKLSDDQVREFFIEDMPPKLGNFIKNNKMPAEYDMVDPALAPRSVVREALPLQVGVLPSDSEYYNKLNQAEQLLAEGLLKPTVTQASNVLRKMQSAGFIASDEAREEILERLQGGNVVYAAADGQASDWHADATQVIDQLKNEGLLVDVGYKTGEGALRGLLTDYAKNAAVARQNPLVGVSLRDRLEKHWMGEPDAKLFTNNAAEYGRAVSLKNQFMNAQPDRDQLEILRQHLWNGEIGIDDAYGLYTKMYEKEWHDIRQSVADYMVENKSKVLAALEGQATGAKQPVHQIVNDVRALQEQIVADYKSQQGLEFIYSDAQRDQIAIGFLTGQLEHMLQSMSKDELDQIIEADNTPPEQIDVSAPMTANVWKTLVKEGDRVEEGDTLMILEAMKMEIPITAKRSGVIEKLNIEEGDNVEADQVLTSFEAKPVEPDFVEKYLAELSETNQSARGKIAQYLSDNAPTEVLGYKLPAREDNQRQSDPNSDFIHLVINRGGCNAKIFGDLKAAGFDAQMIYIPEDKDTPVIRNAGVDETIEVASYTDHDEIIRMIKETAAANPGKSICLNAGWGFLSEDHQFVGRVEKELSGINVQFMGPNSEAMRLAGNKLDFRRLVEEVAPEHNAKFFENEGTAAELQAYIAGGFSSGHALDAGYRQYFEDDVRGRMNGRCAVKAVSGGGGKGIGYFTYNDEKTPEQNYQAYMKEVQRQMGYAENNYEDARLMTEGYIAGQKHHFEFQALISGGKAVILGHRDCTTQENNQKILETNVIEGDYTPEMMDKFRRFGDEMGQKLADIGYEGVATIEVLAMPELDSFTVLETNTRIQVEHAVTEHDVLSKTGKQVSIPVINALLLTKQYGDTPREVLQNFYKFTDADFARINQPADERVMEARINIKIPDFEEGNENKLLQFKDTMLPKAAVDKIVEATGVQFIHGGRGTSKAVDAQIAALIGTETQVMNATALLEKHCEISASQDRVRDHITNAKIVGPLHDVFHANGLVNPDLSVSAVGDGVKSVANDGAKFVSYPDLAKEPRSPHERKYDLAQLDVA